MSISAPSMHHLRDRRGFTLIELLVVIALIVLMVGVLGVALRGGDRGSALKGAQGTLSSLFAGTRGKAALHQTTAALMVNTDPNSEGYLREFRIAYLTSDGEWMPDDPVQLPAGIYLVPDSSLNRGVDMTGWVATRVTTALDVRLDGTDTDGADGFAFRIEGWWSVIAKVSQSGTRVAPERATTTNPKNKIALAPADRVSATEIRFSNPEQVRGAIISHYGLLSLINDAEAF